MFEAPLAFRLRLQHNSGVVEPTFFDCSHLADVFRVLDEAGCPADIRDALCSRLPTKPGEANVQVFGSTDVILAARVPTDAEALEFFYSALESATSYAERVDTAAAWDVVAGFQEALEDLQEAQV